MNLDYVSAVYEGMCTIIMAKTPTAKTVSLTAPTAEAPAPEAPRDPWASLAAYPAEAWSPAPIELTATQKAFAARLVQDGSLVVGTDGWDAPTVGRFIKDVKLLRGEFDGRRISFRTGRVDGKSALLVKLGNPPAETADEATVAA